jgi:peptide/nickel transport system substrate-binding protein
VAETNAPNTFDPIGHSNLNNWYVWQLSYEALVEVLPDGTIAPLLATEWTASPDGLAYTFTLRDGVTFHNSEPFEADDVVYSFERLLAEGIPYAKSKFPALESVEATDDRTVIFHLTTADSSFLLNLGDPFSVANAILNREAGATADPAVAMVGTGPFRMLEYSLERELLFERFEDYWRPGIPAAARLVIRYMPEQQAQIAALQAGQVDLIFPAPESSLVLQGDTSVELISVGSAHTFQINMGSDEPPLDDVRVRRAIALAIDRDEIVVGALLGQGQPSGPFPVGHPWAVPLADQPYYQRDVAAATALLDEAGYGDGLELSFMWPSGFDSAGDRIGEIIQSQLADIGITIVLEPLETGAWVDRLVTANYGLTWVSPAYFSDPRFYIVPRDGRQGPTPAALQELLDQAQAASAEELPEIYRNIQLMEADLVYPFTGLIGKDGYVAFNPAQISGVEADFTLSRRLFFYVSSLK